MNLIGEHLDYNGGRCLPIALPQRTTVTAAPSEHGQISVTSGGLSWSALPGERAEGWAGYAVGVLWALDVDTALELEVTSDVPIGAGLSSSAALECATALAVDALLDLGLSREALAQACIRAETEYVGAPTGGLDQTIALFATGGHALLLDFADGSREAVRWRPEDDDVALLVIDTRVSHELVDGGYASRRQACERAAAELGVTHLTQATLADLERLPAELLGVARHVVTEQARVDDVVTSAQRGSWEDVGALMTQSHLSLRTDFRVSCPELDAVVDTALANGALGARMTGGGFGGSAIALVPSSRTEVVAAAVRDAFAAHDWEAPAVFAAEASQGASLG